MVEVVILVVGGKVLVYMGVGGNFSIVFEWVQLLVKKGVDGYLILFLYLVYGEQEGLYQYVKMIIESIDLNVIFYQCDNIIFFFEQIKWLIEFEQFVGVKDGVGNMDLNINFVYMFGDCLGWFNGMLMVEVMMLVYLLIGFYFYFLVILNYILYIF